MKKLAAFVLCSVMPTLLLHTQTLPAPEISYQDRTVLIGAEGDVAETARLLDMGLGKMGWVQSCGDFSTLSDDPACDQTYTESAVMRSFVYESG